MQEVKGQMRIKNMAVHNYIFQPLTCAINLIFKSSHCWEIAWKLNTTKLPLKGQMREVKGQMRIKNMPVHNYTLPSFKWAIN